MLELIRQFVAGLVLLAGWGAWFWSFSRNSGKNNRGWWIWCALAGFSFQALLVQQACYWGLPVRLSSWVSFSLAAVGLLQARLWRSRRSGSPVKLSGIGPVTVMCVVLGVIQSVALLSRGPAHFFGRAEVDQVNYVYCAQALEDEGAANRERDAGLFPWLAKARPLVQQRITQSVVHAEISALSATDAQSAWGATTVIFIWLLGLAVAGALLSWGLPTASCALAGLVAGALPAVTQTALDGFLSQLSVLWVFVALPGMLSRPRDGGLYARSIFLGTALAYLFCAYTEYFFVGAAVAVAACATRFGLKTAALQIGMAFGVAAALSAGYLSRAAEFFVQQLSAGLTPGMLAYWFPRSGTWAGWGELFLGPAPSGWAVAGGLIVIGALLVGVAAQRFRCLRMLVLEILAPWIATIFVVRALPEFPSYAFAKLTTLAVAPVFTTLCLLSYRGGRTARMCVATVVVLVASTAFFATILAQARVSRGERLIADADLQHIRQDSGRIAELMRSSAKKIVTEDHPHRVAWLCYFFRNYPMYVTYAAVGDRVFPAMNFDFRRPPFEEEKVVTIDGERVDVSAVYEPFPSVVVTGGTKLRDKPYQEWQAGDALNVTLQFGSVDRIYRRWLAFEIVSASPNASTVTLQTQDRMVSVEPNVRWVVPLVTRNGLSQVVFRPSDPSTYVVRIYGPEPVTPDLLPPTGFSVVKRPEEKRTKTDSKLP